MFASTPYFFFFNDTATTEIYTLSLHDALPIWGLGERREPSWIPTPVWSQREGSLHDALLPRLETSNRGRRPSLTPRRLKTKQRGDRTQAQSWSEPSDSGVFGTPRVPAEPARRPDRCGRGLCRRCGLHAAPRSRYGPWTRRRVRA